MPILAYLTFVMFVFFILTTLNYILMVYPNFLRSLPYFERKYQLDELMQVIDTNHKNKIFIIQFTTRGGEMQVINQGLTKLLKTVDVLPVRLRDKIGIEILTEDEGDIDNLEIGKLSQVYLENIRFRVVPKTYETENNTKLKARALQFAVEERATELSTESLENTYIIHFDAESEMAQSDLISVIYSVYDKPSKLILQGPIFYPNYWFDANILSRQMESLRPWNCHECFTNTEKGYPYHLHGSNIVIRGDVEQKVGWDFGNVLSYPVVAEDLFFGIRAFLIYGDQIFGWHGGAMKERPAFSLKASLQQRVRWIRGSLQALEAVPTWKEYDRLDSRGKFRFKGKMYFKLYFYTFGFIPALVALFSMGYVIWVMLVEIMHFFSFGMSTGTSAEIVNETFMPMIPHWMLNLTMFGALLWLITIQIGLHHNLKYQNLGYWRRLREHVSILFVTPLATVFDTGIVFFTTISWTLGYKKATWRVTPKIPSAA